MSAPRTHRSRGEAHAMQPRGPERLGTEICMRASPLAARSHPPPNCTLECVHAFVRYPYVARPKASAQQMCMQGKGRRPHSRAALPCTRRLYPLAHCRVVVLLPVCAHARRQPDRLRVRLCITRMGKTGQHRGADIRTARSPRGRRTTRSRTDCPGPCTAAKQSSGHDSPSRRSAAHAEGHLPTTVPMRSRWPSGRPWNAPRTITAAPIAGAHLCARHPPQPESKLMQGCRTPERWMGARD